MREILDSKSVNGHQKNYVSMHSITGKKFMADLPRDRLLPDEPPFTNIDIDYFGPFEIKRGRMLIKKIWDNLYLPDVKSCSH